MLRKQPQLAVKVVECISEFTQGSGEQQTLYYTKTLLQVLKEPVAYLSGMVDIVGCLKTQVSSADFADERDNQGLIIQLIRRCLVQPPEGPEQTEILILESSLLTETWLHFHQQLVKNTALTLQMIQFLKANLE